MSTSDKFYWTFMIGASLAMTALLIHTIWTEAQKPGKPTLQEQISEMESTCTDTGLRFVGTHGWIRKVYQCQKEDNR